MTQFVRMHTPMKVMARVLTPVGRLKTLTGEQKRIARHMAHEDYTAQQIYEALGITDMSLGTFSRKLVENNIRAGKFHAHARWGKYGRIT